MPVYEFECAKCGAKFSDLVSVQASNHTPKCPKCHGTSTRKLVSRVGKFRPESSRLDEISDKVEGMAEPGSFSEMRSTLREAGTAMEEDFSDEMEEMFEQDLEAGGN